MNLMQLEVERARNLFHEGLKLCDMVSPRLALDIDCLDVAAWRSCAN
jgi:hypothetical protein